MYIFTTSIHTCLRVLKKRKHYVISALIYGMEEVLLKILVSDMPCHILSLRLSFFDKCFKVIMHLLNFFIDSFFAVVLLFVKSCFQGIGPKFIRKTFFRSNKKR